jgi:hypothetical protein
MRASSVCAVSRHGQRLADGLDGAGPDTWDEIVTSPPDGLLDLRASSSARAAYLSISFITPSTEPPVERLVGVLMLALGPACPHI